jgi:hypothetical protein
VETQRSNKIATTNFFVPLLPTSNLAPPPHSLSLSAITLPYILPANAKAICRFYTGASYRSHITIQYGKYVKLTPYHPIPKLMAMHAVLHVIRKIMNISRLPFIIHKILNLNKQTKNYSIPYRTTARSVLHPNPPDSRLITGYPPVSLCLSREQFQRDFLNKNLYVRLVSLMQVGNTLNLVLLQKGGEVHKP